MKKIILIAILSLIASCSVNTSSNINIDVNDIKLIRKGGLCFAIVASRKSFNTDATGLGLANIPCSAIKGLK